MASTFALLALVVVALAVVTSEARAAPAPDAREYNSEYLRWLMNFVDFDGCMGSGVDFQWRGTFFWI